MNHFVISINHGMWHVKLCASNISEAINRGMQIYVWTHDIAIHHFEIEQMGRK